MKKSQIFNQVPIKKPNRNFFDLSHEVKLSGKMGALIPIMCEECVPGDTFRNSSEIMVRFAPMLAPIMHRVDVTTHFFFVPNRLIWDEWETFITGGPEGLDAPVPPHLTVVNVSGQNPAFMSESTLWDYMGLPPMDDSSQDSTLFISALPFRAYTLIYEEYYRDQNLEDPIDFSRNSGEVTGLEIGKILNLRNRAWEKDYFTSALPWTQRGADVLIPMEGVSTINYLDTSIVHANANSSQGNLQQDTTGQLNSSNGLSGAAGTAWLENLDSVEFENASVTINDLRRSIKLQEWLEANARGGSRYTEQIFVHFGEKVPDYRLQRPEYLGGGKQPVVISEVLSTSQTANETNGFVGSLAGHGLSVGRSNKFAYKAVEHGWIIGLMNIQPRTAYFEGVHKKFLRTDKFDYYWKEFANIGEQEIKNMELYYAGNADDSAYDTGTFGYTPRYSEYKFANDRVHGQFRSSLRYWHLGRYFGAPPTLSKAFVECDAPNQDMNRIFYVVNPTIDNLWIQVFNHLKAYRPMPYFGVPSI